MIAVDTFLLLELGAFTAVLGLSPGQPPRGLSAEAGGWHGEGEGGAFLGDLIHYPEAQSLCEQLRTATMTQTPIAP